jgi:hypothetical protein
MATSTRTPSASCSSPPSPAEARLTDDRAACRSGSLDSRGRADAERPKLTGPERLPLVQLPVPRAGASMAGGSRTCRASASRAISRWSATIATSEAWALGSVEEDRRAGSSLAVQSVGRCCPMLRRSRSPAGRRNASLTIHVEITDAGGLTGIGPWSVRHRATRPRPRCAGNQAREQLQHGDDGVVRDRARWCS